MRDTGELDPYGFPYSVIASSAELSLFIEVPGSRL